MIGTIMLANRFGIERGYSAEDLRLLEALANNASVALQYDRLEQAVIKLRALQEQLHHQAYHDPLTDLPNRSLFMERVREELARRRRPIAVLFIDVDDFKTVNDSLGHGVGDALLVSVAGRLRDCVRPQDIVARLGGDEFAVMLPGRRRPARVDGRTVARRASCEAFELPVDAGDGARLGAPQRRHRRTAEPQRRRRRADPQRRPRDVPGQVQGQGALRVLRAADGRRDAAPPRPQGGAGARRSSASRSSSSTSRSSRSTPGRIVAAEALVRWEHPVRGLVPPVGVRAAGRGDRPDRARSAATSCARPAGRRAAGRTPRPTGGEPLRMHVNLSVAELRDPGLVDERAAPRSQEAGIAPEPARARDHRDPAARRRRRQRRRASTSCARSACGSRSTTSAPATRR